MWEAFKKKHEENICTECGLRIYRYEWGGRNHITYNGGQYTHPIDYIVTMKGKTFAEKRELMRKHEEMDREIRKLKIEMGGKFCRDHYRGCPE